MWVHTKESQDKITPLKALEFLKVGNLRFINNLKTDRNFNLIFMDCQMPVMDGFEAIAKIIEFENINNQKHIPIIALTANAFEEDRKKAVAQGMNGHISKPIDVNKIEKVLLSILK